jgi:alpha-amylase
VLLPFTPDRPRKHSHRLSLEQLEQRLVLDVSAPVILQYFEGSDATIERRTADIFNAGYGAVYLPPPGRADSGNQSVGYDVYNRFDLGGPGNPTLYGTETGLKATVAALHQAGANAYIDLVWNHDGFSNLGTPGFAAAGGYPGFALTLDASTNYAGYNDIDGDFHSAFDNSTTGGRLAGLIDIAQEKNYQFIRSPVDPNNPMNLPAGTTPAFGRLANVADPNNARFYPDQSLQPISVFDPTTGEQNIKIYPFNNANPLHGTPVPENALGYLMRYAQWMVQYIGADGFRVDAAKNMPTWVLNYLDRAVYRSSFRTLLNGTQEPIFSLSEVFDGDKGLLQQYVRKDINPADPGRIGGNRDVLDFPLYFAMDSNLTSNGFQNSWFNVVNASQDGQDDGLANNGSESVAFVSNQDVTAPYLSNVAYAYTLTRPGNAIVYYNAHEFGTNRSFPNDGRGDALGGLYGDAITTLVNIRNTHPDGNYDQRDLEKEILIYERDDSMLVALNNRLDSGFDSRTVHTNFAPGTYLVELTGNATDPSADPDGAIPPLLQVDGNGNVNLRVPRNRNDFGVETDKGYVIYAPASPQGNVTINGMDHMIPGETPTADTNGTARLSSIDVITGNSFQIQLNTNDVNLLGDAKFHDQAADGDNAVFKIDGGVDVTGQGFISTNPGDVTYGFQQFTTVHSPGYFSADGNGQYLQTIDVSQLSNGYHYITVRAFRHRNPGEPPIFTDFRMTIYVDRAPTVSAVVSFDPTVAGVNENRTLTVRSTDLRANNVHVFFDLPAGLTNAQILAMVGSGSQSSQIDRDLWAKNATGLTNGNHVATVVSYQVDGSANVQRFPGLFTSTIFGAGSATSTSTATSTPPT